MRWYFRKQHENEDSLSFAYSREAETFDGLIVYDIKTREAVVAKPASLDENGVKAQQKALEHFQSVIARGFPDECYICCG